MQSELNFVSEIQDKVEDLNQEKPVMKKSVFHAKYAIKNAMKQANDESNFPLLSSSRMEEE